MQTMRAWRLATPFSRHFSVAQTSRNKDLVREIYIRELKAYKAPTQAADAHKGQVKEFKGPESPKAPSVTSADLSADLSRWDAEEPIDLGAAGAGGTSAATTAQMGGEEHRQTVEEWLESVTKDEQPPAHH